MWMTQKWWFIKKIGFNQCAWLKNDNSLKKKLASINVHDSKMIILKKNDGTN
jgi:hypothetical protein